MLTRYNFENVKEGEQVIYWHPTNICVEKVTANYVMVKGFKFDKKTGKSIEPDCPWDYIENIWDNFYTIQFDRINR